VRNAPPSKPRNGSDAEADSDTERPQAEDGEATLRVDVAVGGRRSERSRAVSLEVRADTGVEMRWWWWLVLECGTRYGWWWWLARPAAPDHAGTPPLLLLVLLEVVAVAMVMAMAGSLAGDEDGGAAAIAAACSPGATAHPGGESDAEPTDSALRVRVASAVGNGGASVDTWLRFREAGEAAIAAVAVAAREARRQVGRSATKHSPASRYDHEPTAIQDNSARVIETHTHTHTERERERDRG